MLRSIVSVSRFKLDLHRCLSASAASTAPALEGVSNDRIPVPTKADHLPLSRQPHPRRRKKQHLASHNPAKALSHKPKSPSDGGNASWVAKLAAAGQSKAAGNIPGTSMRSEASSVASSSSLSAHKKPRRRVADVAHQNAFALAQAAVSGMPGAPNTSTSKGEHI